MASGGDDRARPRRRGPAQPERAVRRSSSTRQLITFVDSQDPNSRSTIQRHTAHHSNAQRRDARLQSLRSNRPRVLKWTKRESSEALPVTSPSSSNSSSSISPLPPLQRHTPAGEESSSVSGAMLEPPPADAGDPLSPEKDSAAQYLTDILCQHSPNRSACEEIVSFARTDEACTSLLLAYSVNLRLHNGDSVNREADTTAARSHLNRGTILLRERLSDSLTASADTNIQAVLLLIAYTADYGSFEEVRIHANALRTMIDQRGGVEDGNYPAILALQLRSISSSRFFHLTLDCGDPCEALLRFPRGLFAV